MDSQCMDCGAMVEAGQRQCGACGRPLYDGRQSTGARAIAAQKAGLPQGWYIGIVAAAILAIAMVIASYFISDFRDNQLSRCFGKAGKASQAVMVQEVRWDWGGCEFLIGYDAPVGTIVAPPGDWVTERQFDVYADKD